MISLPGDPLVIPEWVGQRDDAPFDVRQYIEELLAPGVDEDAEQWYLNGMSQVSADVAHLIPGEAGENCREQVSHLWEVLKPVLPSSTADNASDNGDVWSPEAAEEVLKISEPALLAVDRAQETRGIVFARAYEWDRDLPHLQAARIYSEILQVELRLAAERDDISKVLTSISRLFRLTRDIRATGPELFSVVANSFDAAVAGTLQDFFLTRSHWRADDYSRVLKLIDEHTLLSAGQMEHNIRRSYILCGNALWELEHGQLSAGDLGMQTASEALLQSIDYSLEWAELNTFYSWLLSDYMKQTYSQELEAQLFSKRLEEIRNRMPPRANQDDQLFRSDGKLTQPLVCVQILPAISELRENCARVEFRRAALGLQLRIRLHQCLHGAPPASLQELLTSTGLKQVPDDPYHDSKLKYRVKDEKILIYSVGKDQIDQDGEIDWDFGRQPGDFIRRMPLH